jgi:hypothetical protein
MFTASTKSRRSNFTPDDLLPPLKNSMQRFLLLLVIVLTFFTYAGQPVLGSFSLTQDRLIVRPRRIVLVRTGKIARQFPDRKTATISYPVISGLSDPAVLRRIRALLDFKNIFDYSLQEYREDSWLSEFSYTVNYNRNSLFDITFNQNGVAAYPDDQSKHFLISLQNGRIIKAADAFLADKFGPLADLVDQKLQAELKEMAKEARQSSNLATGESDSIVEALEQMKFGPENLEEFEVGSKGITFLYDAGLPHAIQAFEPEGRYFFAYAELAPYLNRSGPLGQFVR